MSIDKPLKSMWIVYSKSHRITPRFFFLFSFFSFWVYTPSYFLFTYNYMMSSCQYIKFIEDVYYQEKKLPNQIYFLSHIQVLGCHKPQLPPAIRKTCYQILGWIDTHLFRRSKIWTFHNHKCKTNATQATVGINLKLFDRCYWKEE